MRPFFERTHLYDATAAIERAIKLGYGPTAVGIRLGTSQQTIGNMRRAGRVSNAVFAHVLSDIALENAENDDDRAITSRVLSGMEVWSGASPSDGNGSRRSPEVTAVARGGAAASRTGAASGATAKVGRRATMESKIGRAQAKPSTARRTGRPYPRRDEKSPSTGAEGPFSIEPWGLYNLA